MDIKYEKVEKFLNDVFTESKNKSFNEFLNNYFNSLEHETQKEYINMLLTRSDKNYSLAVQIVSNLPSDEIKLEYLEKGASLFPNAWTKVIESLSSDKKKLEYLKKLEFATSSRARIIASLSSDEEKIKFLSEGTNGEGPEDDYVNTHFCRAKVISSLSSDELKLTNLYKAKNGSGVKAIIIESLSSDKLKIELLNKLKSGELEEKDFDYRKEALSIVLSLSSDKLKLDFLEDEMLWETSDKLEIIATLSSDEEKLKYLNRTQCDSLGKAKIIATLSSDKAKKDFLEEVFLDEGYEDMTYCYYMDVIISLTSDEDKIELIKKMNTRFSMSARCQIAKITVSLSDKQTRDKMIDRMYGKLNIRRALEELGEIGIREVRNADRVEETARGDIHTIRRRDF